MLKVVFLDPLRWDYDVAAPWQRPLGGSQSAVCYLAMELAQRGHRVCVANNISQPREVNGVACWNVDRALADGLFQQPYDAFVVLNGPADVCLRMRPHLRTDTPLLLWTQHAFNQPSLEPLHDAQVRAGWSRIVCVSDWHRNTMLRHFGLESHRVLVLRNAVAPFFENLFADPEALVRAKAGPASLAYTSTPFRGLDVLLDVFPEACEEFPNLHLDVYSSMLVYQVGEAQDPYANLYQRCRAMGGVTHRGSVAQPQLAERLRGTTVLAYPNTFAETSCIAVMEALAAGLAVVTTSRGALPETSLGFATLVPPQADQGAFGRAYLAALRTILHQRAVDPQGFSARLFDQVRAINAHCTWKVRTPEWERALQR